MGLECCGSRMLWVLNAAGLECCGLKMLRVWNAVVLEGTLYNTLCFFAVYYLAQVCCILPDAVLLYIALCCFVVQ